MNFSCSTSIPFDICSLVLSLSIKLRLSDFVPLTKDAGDKVGKYLFYFALLLSFLHRLDLDGKFEGINEIPRRWMSSNEIKRARARDKMSV
jgi:hypothetical protein